MAHQSRVEDLTNGLASLQNRYREMEAEIRMANDDSVQTIKMQRQKITKLRGDNTRVKEDLELETRQARNSLRQTGATTISDLQEKSEFYEKRLQIETEKIQELDRMIQTMEESILKQRSDMGGVNANRETSRTITKNIRMLENRLEKANTKYNEALGHNKKLRETIDNLRRDRAVFDGIYNKLQLDLEQKKAEMSKIMDDAMSAYEARVQAQVEMVKLKETGDKEIKSFEKEWKELNRMIEENQRKVAAEGPRKENKKNGPIDCIIGEERGLKGRLSKGVMQVMNDKLAIEAAEELVLYYREAFQKIQEATRISDIDELARNFEEADKTNFTLFNEANTLNKDIERMEIQIADMDRQIEKAKCVGFNADTQRQKILDDLKTRLDATESKIQFYDKKYEDAMVTVNSLKSGIKDVLLCMNAEREEPDVMERIETVGINESNLMEFLAIIEKRTNTLIQDYLEHDSERANAFTQPSIIDSTLASTACMGIGVGEISSDLMIVPPTTLMDFNDDDI